MNIYSAKVLLVEDDLALASSTLELLDALGYATSLATSAEQAMLQLLLVQLPDVVLLDLQLGRDRSEDVIAQLRARGAPLPPLIILSALPLEALHRAAHATGAQAILQKPCSGQRMAQAIERILDKSALPARDE